MCFDNLIGINTECAPSTSGFNLTDLGITLDHLNYIVGREYADGQELAQAKLDFSVKVVSNLVLQRFSNAILTNTLVDGQRLGQAEENKRIVVGTGDYTGIEVEVCNTNSFLDFNLNSLDLAVEFTGQVEIKVFDVWEAREIDSFFVDAVAGERVTIELNKSYASDKRNRLLLFAYDSTGIDAPQYSVTKGCSSCARSGSYTNSWIKVRGAKLGLAEQPIKSKIVADSFTGGMSINYSLTCNHELWLCQMKNLIALPILYKTGALITEYAIETVRENPETMEDWQSRLERLEMGFRESLDNVLMNIKLPSDTTCFSCAKPVRHISHSI